MLKPFQVVGQKYRIKYLLAYGGMSEVYLAENGQREEVIVKRLLPWFASDEIHKNLFWREAKILKALKHPNIVKFIDFFEEKSERFLVTEFTYGKDLEGLYIKLKKCSPKTKERLAAIIGAQICLAMNYIHERGLLHLDISPANIVIGVNGQVKLIDFGIAINIKKTKNCCSDILHGKLKFMAPEIIKGEDFDHRADIYSLGATLNKCFIDVSTRKKLKKIIFRMREYNAYKRYGDSCQIYRELLKFVPGKNNEAGKNFLLSFINSHNSFNLRVKLKIKKHTAIMVQSFFVASILISSFYALYLVLWAKVV